MCKSLHEPQFTEIPSDRANKLGIEICSTFERYQRQEEDTEMM